MKLVIAVINDNDKEGLLNTIVENGFQATKLASTGGFLREGNTTFMIGVEEEKVDIVLKIIKEVCKKKKKYIPYSLYSDGNTGYAMAYSEPVTTGGAAVFVLDIENYIKI